MNLQDQLPWGRRVGIRATSVLVSSILRASAHLSDQALVRMVRRFAGVNHYPMGQQFLEKGLVSLKHALVHANPKYRKGLIHNLVINEMVRGEAVRSRLTQQFGFDLPVLLVISPTMRCPLRCYGCYSAEYERSSDMDPALLNRILDEAKALGIYFIVVSGGEPFTYPGIHDIWKKHSDMWFQVYTSGVTLNQAGVQRLAELGNVMPCLSVEGFASETDRRRGAGHFERLMKAFANLRAEGVPFGFSVTTTRENNDLATSDAFIKFYIEQGASVGWYFQYMPIGREPMLEMMPTPEQRLLRLQRLRELRRQFPMLLADFWNDGPMVGGCIAAGRRYLHINNAGDVEPCVFCQISTDNIREKSLLEILQTSRLFQVIRKRQPHSANTLRPCMIIDHPDVLKAVIEETQPRETCRGGAFRLVNDLLPSLRSYASRWQALSDPVWDEMNTNPQTQTSPQAKAEETAPEPESLAPVAEPLVGGAHRS
jgi:MoaA/NifB/PqqE/SkfB family radical SAM enzyme